ncbi:MAG: MBL fold metallo-hydrolase [Hyphomonadaceae bacterium]
MKDYPPMSLSLMRAALVLAISALTACQASEPLAPTPPSSLFAATWNSGLDSQEPEFHVQAIDENTIALRQSLRTTFEAPFLYLIFGNDKALLIDTGVKGVDLRGEVDRQIETWLQANGRSNIALTVMHSHGHGDHVGGDSGFESRPDTEIAGHTPEEVSAFFELTDWPSEHAQFDLGERLVSILPTPGHHPSHVMVFDPVTRILFSGDTVYPGKLYFQCGKIAELRKSIAAVSDFAAENDVQWLLGGHVEMTTSVGQTFQSQDRSRRGEHLLELPVSILRDIQAALTSISDRPVITEFDEFVLFPHPADPRGKQPPNWCLAEE